jgi:hypothetical protein
MGVDTRMCAALLARCGIAEGAGDDRFLLHDHDSVHGSRIAKDHGKG